MSSKGSRAPSTGWAYHGGEFVRLGDVKLSPTTQALNYGTGIFEGIRAYWNEERGSLYVLKLKEHYERFERSCRVLRIELPHTVSELCEITLEILKRNAFRQDTYIRPLAYKLAYESGTPVGIRLAGLSSELSIFAVPMGNYVELTGLKCCVSSWRRIPDTSLPVRAKITGSYVNTALAVDEAHRAGCHDAIFLTQDGHISEASAANIFLVRKGELVTPPVTADILEGITRDAVMEMAQKEGMTVVQRDVDRSELYAADEVFLTGTGYQIAPVTEVDGRPVGNKGQMGQVASRLQELYFKAVRGEEPSYVHWIVATEAAQYATR